jgi:hypothetical protein
MVLRLSVLIYTPILTCASVYLSTPELQTKYLMFDCLVFPKKTQIEIRLMFLRSCPECLPVLKTNPKNIMSELLSFLAKH